MNFQEFVEAVKVEVNKEMKNEVRKEASELVGMDVRAEVHVNLKNNGKELVGLILKDEGINIAPTIYLEEYYEELKRGTTLQEIAQMIIMEYALIRFHKPWNVESFRDYDYVKGMLAFKLINFEKNRELLVDTPYIAYLDLAIVFYVLLEVTEKGSATMLVKDMHAESWGVDVHTMYHQALRNGNTLLPAKFQTVTSVISEIVDVSGRSEEDERMYVMSNLNRNFGAACILYPGKLEEIGKYLGVDYYVLPSSIHEVIVVPVGEWTNRGSLEGMVKEVNTYQVADDEVLADTVYYYSREQKRLLY